MLCEEVNFEAGQICGRNGCKGIIQQHHSDWGCSCHIHPPCSFCTTPREFCDDCGWDAEDELVEKAGKERRNG